MRLKRSSYVFATFGVVEVCNADSGASKSRMRGFGTSERARLNRDTDVYSPAAQKGRSSGSSLG